MALAAALVVVAAAVTAGGVLVARGDEGGARVVRRPSTPRPTRAPTPPATTAAPFQGWVDPASVGQPYSGATVPGVLTFRGNPTRTYYGQGPVPAAPRAVWRYPAAAMCSISEDRREVSN